VGNDFNNCSSIPFLLLDIRLVLSRDLYETGIYAVRICNSFTQIYSIVGEKNDGTERHIPGYSVDSDCNCGFVYEIFLF
jgi:hypothetical protein